MENENDELAIAAGSIIVSGRLRKKFDELLALDKLTQEDLKGMNRYEIKQFENMANERLKVLKGRDRDIFLQKIEALTGDEGKNVLWEMNHVKINAMMTDFICQNHRLPTKSEIAAATGLSRQTVYTHLKDYSSSPLFTEQEEEINFMGQQVISNLLEQALKGNLKASKLFLDAIGKSKSGRQTGTVIKSQNNYIQINRTVLSQETIEQLNPEQLKQLEKIIIKKLDNNK